MHIVSDENGQPVSHGHQSECHSHENCRADENGCPEHDHHGHCHAHGSQHPVPQTKEQMTALLDYMSKHNEQHAAELDRLSAQLVDFNRADAAEILRKAVDEFQKGNLYLNLALSMVRDS